MPPSVSGKQQRAMFAAAAGKSKIGIPKKVGAEFAAADRARGPQKLPAVAKPQGFNPTRSPVVAKRAANNGAKGRVGLKNTVTDNDPMARTSDANYP
jgi:hypothetical protein